METVSSTSDQDRLSDPWSHLKDSYANFLVSEKGVWPEGTPAERAAYARMIAGQRFRNMKEELTKLGLVVVSEEVHSALVVYRDSYIAHEAARSEPLDVYAPARDAMYDALQGLLKAMGVEP